jgi:hypothetical protein
MADEQLPHQVEVMSVAEFLKFKSLNPTNPNTTKQQQQQQAQHFLSSTTRGSTNAHENIHMNSARGEMCDTPLALPFTF